MPAPKKYPDEVRERAVRMVFEIREESGRELPPDLGHLRLGS
jgi:transposase-like protein